MSSQSIYDFELETIKKEKFPLKSYEGKVIVIVNTATGCGFTPHYKDLESMYEKYHENGLEIIESHVINLKMKLLDLMRKSILSAN